MQVGGISECFGWLKMRELELDCDDDGGNDKSRRQGMDGGMVMKIEWKLGASVSCVFPSGSVCARIHEHVRPECNGRKHTCIGRTKRTGIGRGKWLCGTFQIA
jgi:hypothetical protein